ncbi:MAG: aminomethyl-transferring glycine dehydrogenase subunit GcvPB [Deltaproteobacteria bacterium]|nr:aminomethyl-transferring glycine dehydrogenase subunit GcvPB [Deltaproteobacteria bacterium]MBN2672817.1 aminomethyl-transferring glycine dehydrogenase subunit GcvPB [Deltaproteobacteria bacterium]
MSNQPGTPSLGFNEPLIYDRSCEGRQGCTLPSLDVPEVAPSEVYPENLVREADAALPELSEPEVVRHYTRLSTWNFSVDHGFYPLGSCTMKYNPKINEWAARLPGFAQLHPYTPTSLSQGALALMVELEEMLAEVSGMHAISLQPAAGAHGELTAMMAIRGALTKRGNPRNKVLIPDTAHGTNPATVTLNGYIAESISSSDDGYLSAEAVAAKMTDDVAALMLTNPNTIGLFEKNIRDICDIVHQKGGFVFGDGANLNAIMGKARPGDFGVDAMQFNLHKTFSTPHGGGGPGSGPVGVCKELTPFLPNPRPIRLSDGSFSLQMVPESVGRVRSFYGNFGVMVKAYTYLRELGAAGLTKVSEMAVLNANYLHRLIQDDYHIPFGNGRCMHEVVASDKNLAPTGVTTLDVAKGLIDRGFHPPTVYFPLVVKGALMCEPTETESRETIEEFAQAMIEIAELARTDGDALHRAPQLTRVSRLDEATAARKPILTATK